MCWLEEPGVRSLLKAVLHPRDVQHFHLKRTQIWRELELPSLPEANTSELASWILISPSKHFGGVTALQGFSTPGTRRIRMKAHTESKTDPSPEAKSYFVL